MNDENQDDPKLPLLSSQRPKYSKEEIDELKLMGCAKPQEVSWGDWVGPKDHSHRHDFLIHLAAAGTPNNMIAEEMGMTESRISILLGQTEMKDKIKLVQEEYWGGNAQKRFENLLPKAIDVAQQVLENEAEKPALRADVAFRLMDRALGKPTQTTEVKGNLISDLLVRLDHMDKTERLVDEESEEEKALDKPKDAIDNFTDEFVPKEVTVGKKGVFDE